MKPIYKHCLSCGRRLTGQPQEYKDCCCYACWKKIENSKLFNLKQLGENI